MHQQVSKLRDNIKSVYLGADEAVDRVLVCLFARGHLLLEDVPGVGKTILATAIAKSIDSSFSRIQLTPDMLPSDVLGVSVFRRDTGDFEFRPGPIFANLVLADEINRTPPRTQTALLEAMNEGSVSVDGEVRKLDPPFMVLATQNPSDFEGTYPLPENQLDRFLIQTSLGYPDPEAEKRLLDLRPAATMIDTLQPAITKDELIALQAEVDAVRIDDAILAYIVDFARATRAHPEVRVGLSPRGALALTQACRSTAFVVGRDYVIPDDLVGNVPLVCQHRIIAADNRPETVERICNESMDSIKSPA
ncbi:MAG: MoxR family ATPase [Planctomycetota bacterium]